MLILNLDDPALFAAQPVCLQVVGRPFEDEELLAATSTVDSVINSTSFV